MRKRPFFPPLQRSSHDSPTGTSQDRSSILAPRIDRHFGKLSTYHATQATAKASGSMLAGSFSTLLHALNHAETSAGRQRVVKLADIPFCI